MKKHNDQHVGDVLKSMIDKYRLKPKLKLEKIKEIWPKLMGASIAKHTKELKVYKNKLYVNIDSAPLKQELSYGKAKLLTMLNKELGAGQALDDIVIR